MKHKKLLMSLFAGVQMLLVCQLYSQWGFRLAEEMKIPSTDTWNFIRHGEVGANLHTGTVNLSVPVYTYKDKDFEIPVTLDYSSNGLVCNMRAGILGPDWVLNAGGSISVEIKGISDLEGAKDDTKSYYDFHQLENPSTDGSYWRYSYLSGLDITCGVPDPEIIYVPEYGKDINDGTDKYDAEPDFFHFNFMGYSGTFHFGRYNNIYVYNTNGNNKLLLVKVGYDTIGCPYITITDKHGYEYQFGSFTDKSTASQNLATAYKLEKIIAPNGRTVHFSYTEYYTNHWRPAAFSSEGNVFDFNNVVNLSPVECNLSDTRSIELFQTSCVLSTITVDNNRVMSFIYEELPEGTRDQCNDPEKSYLTELIDCIRLKNIVVTNPYNSSDTLKTASFSYTASNGARTSYLTDVTLSGEGRYTFDYHNLTTGSFPSINTRSIDHWGYYNNRSSNVFLKIVTGDKTTLDETINSIAREPNHIYAKYGMLEKITYPIGGYSVLEYEPHDYSYAIKRLSANYFEPALISESGTCGGLRIKSVTNYTNSGNVFNSRLYSYTANGKSSGILLHFPKYWLNYTARSGPEYLEQDIDYWSNNLLSHNGSHIEYETVTQINSDGSKEIYYYSNSRISDEYRDWIHVTGTIAERNLQYGDWHLNGDALALRNITAPVTSLRAERGKLLKHETYKSGATVPDKTVQYQYDTTVSLPFDTYPVYLIRRFGHAAVNTDNYKLIRTTTTETLSDNTLSSEESLVYNTFQQIASRTIVNSKGEKEHIIYKYASDYVDSAGIYTTMKELNMLNYPVSELHYNIQPDGTQMPIQGQMHTYALFNGMVQLQKTELYDANTEAWITDIIYTQYDAFGNPLESRDNNGIPTCYIYGYNGLYLVGKAENLNRSTISSIVGNTPLETTLTADQIASIKASGNTVMLTTYEYKPLVGISKITYPGGENLTFEYNASGKLKAVYDSNGKQTEAALYSPDNKE